MVKQWGNNASWTYGMAICKIKQGLIYTVQFLFSNFKKIKTRPALTLTSEDYKTTNSGLSVNLLAFTVQTLPKLGDRQIKFGNKVVTVAAVFPATANPIMCGIKCRVIYPSTDDLISFLDCRFA